MASRVIPASVPTGLLGRIASESILISVMLLACSLLLSVILGFRDLSKHLNLGSSNLPWKARGLQFSSKPNQTAGNL